MSHGGSTSRYVRYTFEIYIYSFDLISNLISMEIVAFLFSVFTSIYYSEIEVDLLAT